MHDYVKTLGTVIRKAREEQGLSQASLAEELGIDVRTIINIEYFRGNPKFEVLYPLVTTLRIPADRIFYPGTESMEDGCVIFLYFRFPFCHILSVLFSF